MTTVFHRPRATENEHADKADAATVMRETSPDGSQSDPDPLSWEAPERIFRFTVFPLCQPFTERAVLQRGPAVRQGQSGRVGLGKSKQRNAGKRNPLFDRTDLSLLAFAAPDVLYSAGTSARLCKMVGMVGSWYRFRYDSMHASVPFRPFPSHCLDSLPFLPAH
ncbi:Methionine synthase [Anopheles sinensis]|uniref:Methionine synthase n=1 Tax=Anopheles sinensis TaxID=74873 RepID=A0A084WS20_ANOSI|nr:Methionine synthase [Anopheles sinensis]